MYYHYKVIIDSILTFHREKSWILFVQNVIFLWCNFMVTLKKKLNDNFMV